MQKYCLCANIATAFKGRVPGAGLLKSDPKSSLWHRNEHYRAEAFAQQAFFRGIHQGTV